MLITRFLLRRNDKVKNKLIIVSTWAVACSYAFKLAAINKHSFLCHVDEGDIWKLH
jgi:hypothetical protein